MGKKRQWAIARMFGRPGNKIIRGAAFLAAPLVFCLYILWQVILPCPAFGGFFFFLYILWQILVPCPASGGPLFVSTKRGGKTTKGAAAPLETPLVRNGRCGCLVSVCVAYRKISIPKFPLTQRRTPPPACLLRVTVCCADSAPARARARPVYAGTVAHRAFTYAIGLPLGRLIR